MKEFVEKYKEVRVQTSREKVTSAQFSMAKNGGDPLNTMFMGSESLSRRQSQEARNRRESNTRRQDYQGRGYYRRYNRSQSYNCNGRPQSQNGRVGDFYREHSQLRSRYVEFNQGQLGNRGQQAKTPGKEP